jgi:hypothetical protein
VQVDPAAFRSVMNYLMSLQLVRTEGERFSVTSLGQQIFRRYGAFCIINSYEGYMRELQALLVPDGRVRPTVNRRRNVIGSGALHEKKFFAPALALMGEERPEVAADIGCGDGQFLSSCARRWPGAPLLGVDLSPVAVEESRRRLSLEAPDSSFTGVVANAVDVDTWATLVPEDVLRERRILLSCWFVIHEISERKVSVIVDFFRRVHARCPRGDGESPRRRGRSRYSPSNPLPFKLGLPKFPRWGNRTRGVKRSWDRGTAGRERSCDCCARRTSCSP